MTAVRGGGADGRVKTPPAARSRKSASSRSSGRLRCLPAAENVAAIFARDSLCGRGHGRRRLEALSTAGGGSEKGRKGRRKGREKEGKDDTGEKKSKWKKTEKNERKRLGECAPQNVRVDYKECRRYLDASRATLGRRLLFSFWQRRHQAVLRPPTIA